MAHSPCALLRARRSRNSSPLVECIVWRSGLLGWPEQAPATLYPIIVCDCCVFACGRCRIACGCAVTRVRPPPHNGKHTDATTRCALASERTVHAAKLVVCSVKLSPRLAARIMIGGGCRAAWWHRLGWGAHGFEGWACLPALRPLGEHRLLIILAVAPPSHSRASHCRRG